MSNPSTKCLRREDSFTKEESNGNGLLEYPVGLITSDEITMAGGKYGMTNTDYYLITGANYWSMTPCVFGYRGASAGFGVGFSGELTYPNIIVPFGLRPVISLKLGTFIVDGDGTGANPYIID